MDATTPLADAVLARLVPAYEMGRDPERAAAMRAYMRDQFPFLGIPTPRRRALSRGVVAGLGRPDENDLRAAALACWRLPEREYQYFACDWLVRHAAVCAPSFLPTVRLLLTTRSWWDTVDVLASRVVGALVARHPAAVSTMDEWLDGGELWLIRSALLHQLTYGNRTDAERLFRYCLARADHPDFFVRKAIGWALRQYARTDPAAVRRFVEAHGPELAPLSFREATRHL